MTQAALKLDTTPDYIVRDISLAEFGRKEISIAETEMPASWPCARNTGRSSR
jgi:adenosylhomocysteinase